MTSVPVICDACGNLFATQNFIEVSGGSAIVHMEGNKVGPCPRCGSMGRIPDGTYRFANNAISLLQGPERSKQELRQFADLLRSVIESGTSVEEVQATIRHEVPSLVPLVEELRKTRNAEWLRFWIKTILTIIGLLLAAQSIQEVNIDIDAAINKTIEQRNQLSTPQPSAEQAKESENSPRQVHKVGRNDPCPCGSGRKYKKCHGDPAREQRTPTTR